MVLILRCEDCHILIGVSSFEVGTDCLCESCSHRQCVLGPHGEGTGPSRTAWENKNTRAELQRVYRQNTISISHWDTTQRQIHGWQRMGHMEIQTDKQNISQFMRQSAADKTNFFICILAMHLNPDLKSRTMPSSDRLYFRFTFLDHIVRTYQQRCI